MEDWGKRTDNIQIWHYNTNFRNYLLPFPNLRTIEANVRYFAAQGAQGVFMQAAGDTLAGEFSDLRTYLISNLLWDPDRSGKQLLNEFITLHYGLAAPALRRYIDVIHDTA